jgi:hypothetical protein
MAGARNSDGDHAGDIKYREILCADKKCRVVLRVSEGLSVENGS